MDMENKNGLMAQSMKAIGKMIKPMALENYFMQTEIFMRENGQKIKLTGREHTRMLMVQDIMVSGKKINSMVEELRHGLMELAMRESTLKEKSMEKES